MASQVEALKYIPGTALNVDGFRFVRPGARHFFLTHFHGDHTTGLTRGFDAGTIYCSPVTARLLLRDMGLRAGVVCPLLPHVAVEVAGVRVTPLPANHCPGAVMFLFVVPGDGEGRPPRTVLHTGDMRWADREMMAYPALRALGALDALILDTTYCAPRWTFPPQHEVVEAAADFVAREAARVGGRVLAVANSYHIGKERFYFGLAVRLKSRVYCTPQKARVLSWLDLPPAWLALLTQRPLEADVHLLAPGEQLTPAALEQRLHAPRAPWAAVIGFRATGWSYKKAPGAAPLSVWREGRAAVVGAPYSEHSSWTDLRACVASLRPRRIIPSVNAADSSKARALVDCFADLMDLKRDRSRLHAYFRAAKECVIGRVFGGERAKERPPLLGGPGPAERTKVEEAKRDWAEEARCKEAGCQAAGGGQWEAQQDHARPAALVKGPMLVKIEDAAMPGCMIVKTEDAATPGLDPPGRDSSQSATDWEDGSPGGCSPQSRRPASPHSIDLTEIDVGEQAQILAGILAHRAGGGKRKAADAVSLVQGSLKRLWGREGGELKREASDAALPCVHAECDPQST